MNAKYIYIYNDMIITFVSYRMEENKISNVEAVLKYRAKNKDKYNQYQKEYMANRRANPQVQQREKELYDKNRDKINQRRRELYALKKEKQKAIIKIQNAYRNKRAIYEVADRFVQKQVNNYYRRI